jgi:acetoacetate decarboxylase
MMLLFSTVEEAFSTPWDAPLIPKFPIQFRNTRIFTVLYRTQQANIQRILPQPLESANDLVVIHYYHMTDAEWFGNYYESAVQVEVRIQMADGEVVKGNYSPYLALGSDGAVAAGREIYGQPKKSGDPQIEFNGDLIIGRINRNGINIVTSTMAYKQQRSHLDELRSIVPFEQNINLKMIPHIDGTLAIKQLTARTFSDLVVHECWRGWATTEIHPHAQLPICKLPVVEMLEGFYWVCDLTLPMGRILLDYLADSGGNHV